MNLFERAADWISSIQPEKLYSDRWGIAEWMEELKLNDSDLTDWATAIQKLKLVWELEIKLQSYMYSPGASHVVDSMVKSCCFVVLNDSNEEHVDLALRLLSIMLLSGQRDPQQPVEEGIRVPSRDLFPTNDSGASFVKSTEAMFRNWTSMPKREERLRLFLLVADRFNRSNTMTCTVAWTSISVSCDKIIQTGGFSDEERIHILHHYALALENVGQRTVVTIVGERQERTTLTGYENFMEVFLSVIMSIDINSQISSSAATSCLLATHSILRFLSIAKGLEILSKLQTIPNLTLKWAVWTGLCCFFLERKANAAVSSLLPEEIDLFRKLRSFSIGFLYVFREMPSGFGMKAEYRKSQLLQDCTDQKIEQNLTNWRLPEWIAPDMNCEFADCKLTLALTPPCVWPQDAPAERKPIVINLEEEEVKPVCVWPQEPIERKPVVINLVEEEEFDLKPRCPNIKSPIILSHEDEDDDDDDDFNFDSETDDEDEPVVYEVIDIEDESLSPKPWCSKSLEDESLSPKPCCSKSLEPNVDDQQSIPGSEVETAGTPPPEHSIPGSEAESAGTPPPEQSIPGSEAESAGTPPPEQLIPGSEAESAGTPPPEQLIPGSEAESAGTPPLEQLIPGSEAESAGTPPPEQLIPGSEAESAGTPPLEQFIPGSEAESAGTPPPEQSTAGTPDENMLTEVVETESEQTLPPEVSDQAMPPLEFGDKLPLETEANHDPRLSISPISSPDGHVVKNITVWRPVPFILYETPVHETSSEVVDCTQNVNDICSSLERATEVAENGRDLDRCDGGPIDLSPVGLYNTRIDDTDRIVHVCPPVSPVEMLGSYDTDCDQFHHEETDSNSSESNNCEFTGFSGLDVEDSGSRSCETKNNSDYFGNVFKTLPKVQKRLKIDMNFTLPTNLKRVPVKRAPSAEKAKIQERFHALVKIKRLSEDELPLSRVAALLKSAALSDKPIGTPGAENSCRPSPSPYRRWKCIMEQKGDAINLKLKKRAHSPAPEVTLKRIPPSLDATPIQSILSPKTGNKSRTSSMKRVIFNSASNVIDYFKRGEPANLWVVGEETTMDTKCE